MNLKIDSLKKIIILSLLIFSIPVLSTTTTPAIGAVDWSVKTIATDPYQVRPTITVDESGSPHIAYISPDGIMYAYTAGEAWIKEVVNSAADYSEYELPIENHPGVRVSFDSPRIALDSVGNPNIAHLTKLVQCTDRFCTFWWVRLAAKLGGNWTDQILLQDSLAGGFSNLRFTVDPVDRLHMTALAFDGVGVMYSPYSASLPWNFTAVPFIDAPGSISADAFGTPYICGQPRSNDNGGLAYTYRSGVDWTYENIDPTVRLGGCSIAVDSSGNPHIGFSNNANKTLWYAVKPNNSWEIERVAAKTGADVQLILDASSSPHILYTDASNGDLKYAVKSGGNWVIETIDTGTDRVWGPSFALDRDGNPHVTYIDNKARSLKYVTTKNHSTTEPRVVDVSTVNIRDDVYQSVFTSTDTVRINANVNGSNQQIKDIKLTLMDAKGRAVLSATPLTKSNSGDYSYFYDYVLASLSPDDYDALVTVTFSDSTIVTGFDRFRLLRPVAATQNNIPWINGT